MASIRKIKISTHHYLLLTLTVILIISCSAPNKVISEETIDNFARLQCTAVQFKNARYTLSEEMRTEEAKTPLDTIQLKAIKVKADSLKTLSLDLADILKVKLDSIFETLKENPNDKTAFYLKLEEKLNELGCANKKDM